MRKFTYSGRTRDGKKVSGTIFAKDQAELVSKLDQQEIILIATRDQALVMVKGGLKLSGDQVLNFTINLNTMLKGGLSLIQSIDALLQDTTDKKLIALLASLKDHVSAGGAFKDALSQHPQVFSTLYRAIVESGESTGKLDVALENIAAYLEWLTDIKRKMVEMSVYPTIVFIVMVGVITVLVGFVIPKFQPLFRDMQIELPLPTQIVLQVSSIFSQTWYLIFGGFGAIFFAATILLKNKAIRWLFDKYKLQIPIVGDLMYKLCLAQFSRGMYLCLSGGIPMIRTLEMAESIIGNSYLGSAIKKVREGVNTGAELSAGLTLTKVFPTFLVCSVSVGEKSGKLPDSFRRVCEFYDKEVPRIVDRLFSMFEPLLIVVMGSVVGGIAFAVFMPLMKIMQGVGASR